MQRYGPGVALIVVDVQNDFVDPNGSLSVRGGEGVVPRVNREIDAAIGSGAIAVYTQDWHPESTPHFAKDGGTWPVHCVADTWGAEFAGSLRVDLDAAIIRKGTNGEDGYSGFTMRDPVTGETRPTRLEQVLRDAGVTAVVVCGLATDYCVNATAIDATRLGFATTVVSEACAAVDLQPGDGDRALAEMRDAGVAVATTARR